MYLVIKEEKTNDWERVQSGKTPRTFTDGKSTPEAKEK